MSRLIAYIRSAANRQPKESQPSSDSGSCDDSESSAAVSLLQTAMDKRRAMFAGKKDVDLRRQLLHASLIRRLCKSIGETRKQRRRKSRAKNRGLCKIPLKLDDAPGIAPQSDVQDSQASRTHMPSAQNPYENILHVVDGQPSGANEPRASDIHPFNPNSGLLASNCSEKHQVPVDVFA